MTWYNVQVSITEEGVEVASSSPWGIVPVVVSVTTSGAAQDPPDFPEGVMDLFDDAA